MTAASPKIIVRGGKLPVHVPKFNSDPLGRVKDNVHPDHFGKASTRGRSTSMHGLRPSFFAMLRGETSPPSKGN